MYIPSFTRKNVKTMLQYSGVYLELYFQLINDVFFTTMKKNLIDFAKLLLVIRFQSLKQWNKSLDLAWLIEVHIFKLF